MEDLNDKVTGGTLTAAEWNQVPSEIQNVIENLGITLSGADLNQLGKGIAGYVANGTFYTDSGAADAYVLTTIGSKQSLTAYTDGMVIDFETVNDNTGASTVNVAALGVKSITDSAGVDPAAGEISGKVRAVFDSANDRFTLDKTGIVTRTVITASGTYNPPADVRAIKFICVGAGAGGAGCAGGGAATTAAGVAGAGGGLSEIMVAGGDIVSSYTITIGAAGSGGAAGANPGTNGGTSSVVGTGVNLTANGGVGGATIAASSGSTGGNRALGGTATGGDINLKGQNSGGVRVAAGDLGNFPLAGASPLGAGGGCLTASTNSNGSAAVNPGEGGGGAVVSDSAGTAAGGDGFRGEVTVEEYF